MKAAPSHMQAIESYALAQLHMVSSASLQMKRKVRSTVWHNG